MVQVDSFPLCWPSGWKRATAKKNGTFTKNGEWVTVSEGARRITESLAKMGIKMDTVIVSTNVKPRLDGLPRSGEPQPQDPGAAVYWAQRGHTATRCMAIDRYSTVADNLAAIAATLEAMRAIERHGGAEILDRAFTGFKALNAENEGESWWKTLGIGPDATRAQVEVAYRNAAKQRHPDAVGGSHDAMANLNLARDQALAAVKG